LIANAATPIALTAFVALLSFFTLLFGELVPKRLALRNAERFARIVAPAMQWVSQLTKPLVWGLAQATSAVLFLLGAGKQEGPTVSVDDIEHLLETGRAEGVVEPVEQAVAIEALRLGERTVRDIMRPRIELDALDIETPLLPVAGLRGITRSHPRLRVSQRCAAAYLDGLADRASQNHAPRPPRSGDNAARSAP
jgi:putative hemolysin